MQENKQHKECGEPIQTQRLEDTLRDIETQRILRTPQRRGLWKNVSRALLVLFPLLSLETARRLSGSEEHPLPERAHTSATTETPSTIFNRDGLVEELQQIMKTGKPLPDAVVVARQRSQEEMDTYIRALNMESTLKPKFGMPPTSKDVLELAKLHAELSTALQDKHVPRLTERIIDSANNTWECTLNPHNPFVTELLETIAQHKNAARLGKTKDLPTVVEERFGDTLKQGDELSLRLVEPMTEKDAPRAFDDYAAFWKAHGVAIKWQSPNMTL